MSKRAEIRQRIATTQRRRRLTFLLVVIGAVAVIATLLIYPSLTPVGDIVTVTPAARAHEEGRQLGEPDAPVLVELYEDFQCPTCRVYSQTVEPQIIATYVETGVARLAYRHFAFIGPESIAAANASMCADEQGRFWDYHDVLFANQSGENLGAFADRRLLAFAESLGLDLPAFRACSEDETYQEVIDSERSAGFLAGIDSTPSVLVNGTLVQGSAPNLVPTFELVAAAIEAAMTASSTSTP